jgi:hypothetical protein
VVIYDAVYHIHLREYATGMMLQWNQVTAITDLIRGSNDQHNFDQAISHVAELAKPIFRKAIVESQYGGKEPGDRTVLSITVNPGKNNKKVYNTLNDDIRSSLQANIRNRLKYLLDKLKDDLTNSLFPEENDQQPPQQQQQQQQRLEQQQQQQQQQQQPLEEQQQQQPSDSDDQMRGLHRRSMKTRKRRASWDHSYSTRIRTTGVIAETYQVSNNIQNQVNDINGLFDYMLDEDIDLDVVKIVVDQMDAADQYKLQMKLRAIYETVANVPIEIGLSSSSNPATSLAILADTGAAMMQVSDVAAIVRDSDDCKDSE